MLVVRRRTAVPVLNDTIVKAGLQGGRVGSQQQVLEQMHNPVVGRKLASTIHESIKQAFVGDNPPCNQSSRQLTISLALGQSSAGVGRVGRVNRGNQLLCLAGLKHQPSTRGSNQLLLPGSIAKTSKLIDMRKTEPARHASPGTACCSHRGLWCNDDDIQDAYQPG
jgi:hypothetical protein